jgi:hypothetical protein
MAMLADEILSQPKQQVFNLTQHLGDAKSVVITNKRFIHRPEKVVAKDETIYQQICVYLFQCMVMMDKKR